MTRLITHGRDRGFTRTPRFAQSISASIYAINLRLSLRVINLLNQETSKWKKNEKSCRTSRSHVRSSTISYQHRCLERKRVVVDYRARCAILSIVSQESHWHSAWRIMLAQSTASLSCCHRFGKLPNVYLSRTASKRKRPVFPLKSKPLRFQFR